jgi:hypothetical protein
LTLLLPLLAQQVTQCDAAIWSLSGEKRTSSGHRNSVVPDPERTWGEQSFRAAQRHDRIENAPISA